MLTAVTLRLHQAAGLELAAPNVSSFLKKLLGLNHKVKQRFFPQCNGCSSVRHRRIACHALARSSLTAL